MKSAYEAVIISVLSTLLAMTSYDESTFSAAVCSLYGMAWGIVAIRRAIKLC